MKVRSAVSISTRIKVGILVAPINTMVFTPIRPESSSERYVRQLLKANKKGPIEAGRTIDRDRPITLPNTRSASINCRAVQVTSSLYFLYKAAFVNARASFAIASARRKSRRMPVVAALEAQGPITRNDPASLVREAILNQREHLAKRQT